MSKQYSLAELLKEADVHFEKLHVDKLYATSDGQYFVIENRALLHATPNKMRVFTLVRGDEPPVIDSKPEAAIPKHDVDTHGENVAQPEPADEKPEAAKPSKSKAGAKK